MFLLMGIQEFLGDSNLRTSVAAYIGMVISLYNLVDGWFKERLRLKVTPIAASFARDGV